MNGKQTGTVEVIQKGLYYQFFCSCVPQDDKIYRIYLQNRGVTTNLGVCVPEENRLILKTKIPVKNFKERQFSFFMTSGNGEKQMISVESGMKFPCLHMLENACLQTVNGKRVIMINQYQDRSDSDQNQEYLNGSELK